MRSEEYENTQRIIQGKIEDTVEEDISRLRSQRDWHKCNIKGNMCASQVTVNFQIYC